MRLGIQNPIIQTNNILLRKQQIKVLERLREPETLHLVAKRRFRSCDVVDGAVAVERRRVFIDGLEHAPAGFAPFGVAGYAVHVPYGFDGFGAAGGVSRDTVDGGGEGSLP